MKRREFCRQLSAVGGALMAAPLLQACQSVTPPAEPDARLPTVRPTQSPATTEPPATAVPTSTTTPAPTTEPQPTATSQPTPKTDVTYVALVKTRDRAAGVQRAIELLAINPARSLPVLLKPNFNSADRAPASTHPDTLRALIQALQAMGARTITIGERSGMGDTRQVMQQNCRTN